MPAHVTVAPRPELSGLTLHLPLNTLALRRGGLVTAVLRRANLLAAAELFAGVRIEVLGLQPRLSADVEGLRASGHLHPGVAVRSVLRSLDPSAPNDTQGLGRRRLPRVTPVTSRAVLRELVPWRDAVAGALSLLFRDAQIEMVHGAAGCNELGATMKAVGIAK